jgi:uncharacterized protein DUF3604
VDLAHLVHAGEVIAAGSIEELLMTLRSRVPAAVFALAWTALAHAQESSAPSGLDYHSRIPPAQRQAYFGELHLHTVMSLDAWTYGTKITPGQAYKFARGEAVMVAPIQATKEEGIAATALVPAKRAWPLDFTAVTDHSEFLGALHQLDDPNSAFSHSSVGKQLEASGTVGFRRTLRSAGAGALQPLRDAGAAANGWAVEMKAANDNYVPGKFTTFIGYEWSALAEGKGVMHRNVIFDSDHAPAPFTALDSRKPEDLWKYLESVRARGIDVLAIPHNSNKSDGHDFDWNMSDGRPIDESYAQQRAFNEPLVEISQHKGTSETTPELSPADEFANFELIDSVNPIQHGSYVREAYGRGLVIQSRVGVDPFKMGIVGASDFHNGLSTSDESAYAGTGPYGIDPKTLQPAPAVARDALNTNGSRSRREEEGGKHNPVQYRGGSLTGVWAEENTRESIFAALKRKETFGTSGTRIRVRMFGGWSFGERMPGSADWVAEAYAEGVPMGGDLPARPAAARAPTFLLQAQKDPDGANLDRIQIVKIWLDHANYREKVFDVALSGNRPDRTGHAQPVGNTVDLTTGAYRNTIGAAALQAVWRDPEFDPNTPAVYYGRVLEIPTARWSTLLAIRNKLALPPTVPATLQERAWSSPIWFTPERMTH